MNSHSIKFAKWLRCHLLILSLLCFVISSKAQINDDNPIKVDTYLVSIPVIAKDKDGRNVAGLTKENFTIVQDGVKQEIAYFAEEEAPVNVAVLIDTSYSARRTLGDIKDAAKEFVKVLRPDDKALIIGFNTQISKFSSFTSDQNELLKAISKVHIGYRGKLQPDFQGEVNNVGSYLQDAVYKLVVEDFSAIKGRKAIIILGDGEYRSSEISDQKLLAKLAESDVVVYQLLIRDESLAPNKIRLPDSLTLPNGKITHSKKEIQQIFANLFDKYWSFINELANVTGGRLYPEGAKNFNEVSQSLDIKQIFQIIADEIKKQYVIGFYPQNVESEKQTIITVDVDPDDIVIRTKQRIRLRESK